MTAAARIATAVVAALQGYFMILEMFLWATPFGARTFGRSLEELRQSKDLAANQGLYNGLFAAALVWALIAGDVGAREILLGCIVVAGVFGAITASRKILFVQALPAAIALVLTVLR